MHAVSEIEHHKRPVAVRKSNTSNISIIRRDWFNGLGDQLQAMLRDTYRPAIACDTSLVLCQRSTKAAYTPKDSLANTTTIVATQQIMSCTLPRMSLLFEERPQTITTYDTPTIRPYLHSQQPFGKTPPTTATLESLLSIHGRVSHMVLMDTSYNIFMSKEGYGALCYKHHSNVAVICGDPLCEPNLYDHILREFQSEHELSTQSIAFIGMSEAFRQFAERKQWLLLNFGTERSVDPTANPILAGACGKRIYSQSRQLLDPKRGNLKLTLYDPAEKRDEQLESNMRDTYEHWRFSRKESERIQSYLTIVDLCSYPGEMFYLCAQDKDGRIHGFAGLRRLGADRGFHLDPCIEATFAQRGVTDLLIIASMALLKSLNIGSLSLGFEPLIKLPDVAESTTFSAGILRYLYQQTVQALQLEGKRHFNDRFKPDDTQSANVYLCFPTTSLPRIQQLRAVIATVHLDVQRVLQSLLTF